MKIIVCMKQVPAGTNVEIDPETGAMKRLSSATRTNPYDLFALETALLLKEKMGGTVTVLTMGPAQAESMMKDAYACGADEAVILSDRKFAGSDVLSTSYTLRQGIQVLGGADLIICGRQTTDGDTAQVGPEIAEHLGYPQVTYGLEAEVDGDTIKVKKEVEEGVEVIAAKMPAVVTFTKPAWDPRYPTIKRKMAANRAEIPTLTSADFPDIDTTRIGLKGSPTHVKRSFVPERKKSGVKIQEETGAESAVKLAQLLSDAHVI